MADGVWRGFEGAHPGLQRWEPAHVEGEPLAAHERRTHRKERDRAPVEAAVLELGAEHVGADAKVEDGIVGRGPCEQLWPGRPQRRSTRGQRA